MNTKKIVAMTIALIMTTGMVAGCGNSVDHKDSEVSSTVETTIDKDVDKTVDKESKPDKAEDNKNSEFAEKADEKENAEAEASDKVSDKKADASDKKTDKPNANKADKGSVQANNSSVSKPNKPAPSKPNSNNGNHNGSVNKPSKPDIGNNGNHNGSVNKPSEPVEKPSEPETPAPHVHDFSIVISSTNGTCSQQGSITKKCSGCNEQTTVSTGFGNHNMVHHDAQGHEVTDYDEHYICNQCGMDFGDDDTAAAKHIIVTQGCQNYSLKQVPVGSHWEETSPAYDECSICGKR